MLSALITEGKAGSRRAAVSVVLLSCMMAVGSDDFGPGDVAQAHTAREFVSVDQVDAATAVLERVFGD